MHIKKLNKSKINSILGNEENHSSEELPGIAIIVLNWEGWRDTIECLESLQRLTYPNYKLIVVDNGSVNDSVEKIKAWAKGELPVESKFFKYDPNSKPVYYIEYERMTAEDGGITIEEAKIEKLSPNRRMVIIRNKENLGFAGGNNVGIRYALKLGYSYICLLNNDTVIDPLCLNFCVETFKENKYIGAMSPKILWYDEPQKIWYAGAKVKLWRGDCPHIGKGQFDNTQFSGSRSTEHVTGCALIVKRDLFEELGLLNEEYFLIHEDIDWSLRVIKKTEFKLAVNLSARVWHKSGGISASGRINPISAYFSNKHRFLIVFRYGSLLDKFSFLVFYVCSRLIKFIQLFWKHRVDIIQAELEAVFDFCRKRYGSVDRERVNTWKKRICKSS